MFLCVCLFPFFDAAYNSVGIYFLVTLSDYSKLVLKHMDKLPRMAYDERIITRLI